jgi:hypothetical protein
VPHPGPGAESGGETDIGCQAECGWLGDEGEGQGGVCGAEGWWWGRLMLEVRVWSERIERLVGLGYFGYGVGIGIGDGM